MMPPAAQHCAIALQHYIIFIASTAERRCLPTLSSSVLISIGCVRDLRAITTYLVLARNLYVIDCVWPEGQFNSRAISQ